MSYPLRRPDPPATFTASDCAGEVILWIHGGYHEAVPTREYGTKPAVRGTVVMLSGRASGIAYDNQMLFGLKQSSQFQGMPPGDVALCRIVLKGKSVVFEPGSGYDEQVANAWIDGHADKLEQLRADAVRVFAEESAKLSAAAPPNVSPQWTPPAPQAGSGNGERAPLPGDQQLPLELPADATRQSLTQPGVPATADETGY